jgi:hypothetical protein
LDWIGQWIGLDWIGLKWIRLDWIGSSNVKCTYLRADNVHHVTVSTVAMSATSCR